MPITQQGSYDAVLCDIDGCLAPEDGGPARAELLAQIADHNRRTTQTGFGPIVTVCTGRPIPFAEAISRIIANTSVPAIGEMGVWLYDPTDQLMHRDPAIRPEHQRAVEQASAWIRDRFTDRPLFQQPGKTSSISLFHEDTDYLMSLLPELRDKTLSQGWPLRVTSTWCWINLDLAHISKSTGIDRLCAHAGLNPKRLAGIGDTMGDMAIRDRVEWFCCPANAAEGLKAHADYVSPKEEIEGVLDILSKLNT